LSYRRIGWTLAGVEYWTIEVLDAEYAAAAMWRTAYGERLAETAVTHGAKEWGWGARDWGVIFEVAFADEADWLHFRATPAVCARWTPYPTRSTACWSIAAAAAAARPVCPAVRGSAPFVAAPPSPSRAATRRSARRRPPWAPLARV